MAISRNISIAYEEYASPDDLAADDLELVIEARKAARNAYAPYSGFSVGAAVRLSSGIIVKGANVENAAFPSGICAERSAISGAVSNYPGDVPRAIAIAAMTADGFTSGYVSPCGSCRQVIAEEETRRGSKIRIILSGMASTIVLQDISSLLPLQFDKRHLRNDRP